MKINHIERPKLPEPIIYNMAVGNSGRAWFYPRNIPNVADHIHVTAYKEWWKRGEGYGGSTLLLHLANDQIPFELRGGWHSNSHSLFEDAGLDFTSFHYTRCVISGIAEPDYKNGYDCYEVDDVRYIQNYWSLGNFDAPKKMAQEIADFLGYRVHLYVQSIGGGSYGWVKPSDTVSK